LALCLDASGLPWPDAGGAVLRLAARGRRVAMGPGPGLACRGERAGRSQLVGSAILQDRARATRDAATLRPRPSAVRHSGLHHGLAQAGVTGWHPGGCRRKRMEGHAQLPAGGCWERWCARAAAALVTITVTAHPWTRATVTGDSAYLAGRDRSAAPPRIRPLRADARNGGGASSSY
jgi:hypothetical protein